MPAEPLPLTAPPPRTTLVRVMVFLAVTAVWALFVGATFASNRAHPGGPPLADLSRRLDDKVFLVATIPALRDAPGLGDPVEPYRQRARQATGDDVERAQCRLAVALVKVGRKQEALDLLKGMLKAPKAQAPATALVDSFSLGPAQATPPGLPPSSVHRHEAILKKTLDGWQLTVALAALLQRAGRSGEARVFQDEFERARTHALWQLGLVAAIVVVEVATGLGLLLFWLVRLLGTAPQEDSAPGARPPCTFDPLLGWCMGPTWSVSGTAVMIMLISALRLFGAEPHRISCLVGGQLLHYAAVVSLIGLVVHHRWNEIGVSRPRRSDLAAGLQAFAAAFVLVMGASVALQWLTQDSSGSNNPIFEFLRQMDGPSDALLMFFFVGLVGPVFEELLFRGLLYTSMRQVMGPLLAIPLNALIFSAVHGDSNGFIPLALLGMVMAFVYERTRSIWASSVMHCLWNAQTFAATLLFFG